MRRVLIVVMFVLFATSALAEDSYIINSRDWQDVYTGIQYAKLLGGESKFVMSERHALEIIPTISKDKDIIVIEGRRSFSPGYANLLIGSGLSVTNLDYDDNLNLALAELLSQEGIGSYIVLSDARGYNSISAAPYAVVSRSFVLFANPATQDDLLSFVANQQPQTLLVYGHIGRDINDGLAGYISETVDTGNRFDDNIEIVKKYMSIRNANQTILSNGEFIEDELMSGKEPVIFIGQSNIPEQTREYIQQAGFKNAVLIGNNLIPTASFIKNQLGVYVFVKFAIGRVTGGMAPDLSELETFPVPRFALAVDIDRVSYNLLTNSLEVRYRNLVDAPAYFKSTITIEEIDTSIGDDTAVFIDANQEKTIAYPLNLAEDIASGSPLAEFLLLFGDSPESLEFLIEKNISITTIRIIDSSDIRVVRAYYDKGLRAIVVEVENTGEVDAYVNAEIAGLLVDGAPMSVASDRTILIEAGKTDKLSIRQQMNELDLEDNPKVSIKAFYGEREGNLYRSKEVLLDLEIRTLLNATNIGIVIGALIVMFIIFFVLRRRKKDR